MARGWESKSIEAQIDAAEARKSAVEINSPAPEILESLRKRENILLSRTRVVHELDSAQNPRYRVVLKKALADLDARLSACAVD